MSSTLESKTEAIADAYMTDEMKLVRRYIQQIAPDTDERRAVYDLSVSLIEKIRAHPDFNQGLDAFMAEYSLDSAEGIRLMTLAEALARIPDEETKESLIRSKLTGADWAKHMGKSLSPFVNSSTRALLYTSNVLESDIPFLSRVVREMGEPTIRLAVEMGMRLFSDHFVLGQTLEQAKKKMAKERRKYRYSFDMLGEAALTAADAKRFFDSYRKAIEFAGGFPNAAVSIKLSALHPRYDANQRERVHAELYPALNELVGIAKQHDIQVTIDAEEANRLELSLELLERLVHEGNGHGFDRLGLAVQAYSRRAMSVLEYTNDLAQSTGQQLCVRLVKGAYWDTEIKHAQMLGLPDYPVFTRKAHTDISFLACARYLIDHADRLFPQFASHNVQTVSNLLYWTEGQESMFEFQRLHGMGSVLYDCLLDEDPDIGCTIYAPIGPQKELLPYLIRRLLENSANSSFVNQLASDAPADLLSQHPIDVAAETEDRVSKPAALYPDRLNSAGLDPRFSRDRRKLKTDMARWRDLSWGRGTGREIRSPVDGHLVGNVDFAAPTDVGDYVTRARAAAVHWSALGASQRANRLRGWAQLMEDNRAELICLINAEAGKTIEDGIAEIREAVDFCRYYAAQMEKMGDGEPLPGPNGENNRLIFEPRGVFACISPWNFPVAIFTGQVAAALVAGNAVIAKPAEQTTLIAQRVAELAANAGITEDALQILPGAGDVGAALVAAPGIDGVAFTGSVDAAKSINRTLADRDGAIVPLIAETGGQNAMVVDSTALPEQVVKDVIISAFNSTGQRCSALRVLYLQKECADTVLGLLAGAMAELSIGDPAELDTDVGPVIDREALERLEAHEAELAKFATLIARTSMPDDLPEGHYFAPCCYQLDTATRLTEEHFGPILHVVRYNIDDIDDVIDEINGTGYGLTFGVHSRNERFAEMLAERIAVGNVYINRNIVGAVVGTQPFGGRGLSGTGPKAGGPLYLPRFMTEKARSDNLAAIGGAIDLINQHG